MDDNNNFDWDAAFDDIERRIRELTNSELEDNIDDISRTLSNNKNIDDIDVFALDYYDLNEILESLSNDDKIKLFDRIVERIKNNPNNSYQNNRLIESLPPEIRIRYVDYYDFEIYSSLQEFIVGITDEEVIFKAAKKALKQTESEYTIISIFSLVPDNKKIEFLKLIAEKEKELHTDLINQFNIDNYLKEINIEQRLDVIKNVIFKDFRTSNENDNPSFYNSSIRFDDYSYPQFLVSFIDEEPTDLSNSKMFKTLVFLTEESKKINNKELNDIVGISRIGDIIKIFYEQGYNPKKIVEYLMNSGAIENKHKYALDSIVEVLPAKDRKDMLEFIINLNSGKISMSQYEFFNSLDFLTLDEAKELYIKYCIDEKKYNYLFPITRINYFGKGHPSFHYLNTIFETLSKEELDKSFEEIELKFTVIRKYPKYDDKYNLIVSTFSKRYNLDEKKLLPFIKTFGYEILKYLKNKNIITLINNTNDKDIEKLLNLFTDKTISINKSIINDISNSLLQRQFMLEDNKTYNIFSRFEYLVQNHDTNGINKLLDNIFKEFDYSSILKKNNCSMNDLYNQIIAGNLDLLHKITNEYIAFKREKFAQEKLPNIWDLLSMKKVIARDSYKNDIIQHRYVAIKNQCQELKDVVFTEEQKQLIENDDLMWKIINFKRNPNNNKLDNKDKKYLKVLNELLNIMYDNKADFQIYNPDDNSNNDLKFDLIQDDISNDYLIGILLELNYDGLINVLSNDNNYNSLKKYLERYKIVGWQNMFLKLMVKGDIQFDEGTIAGLISNYDKIKPYIDNKKSLTSIIDYANCFSTTSSLYKTLFGVEDYNLIAANSGRNKASMTKYDRLKKCKDLVPLMYAKKSFSVPTVNEKFKLSNGNDIRIVVGNATNMMNLTYGERTDACMRMGGAFNSLFEHCATDKNGFHIRFVNPDTGQLISRVSGTRNGNTLFLNELRDSLDPDYSNENLYEAIKIFSKHLIQLSKDSSLPIDNIIITSDYALEEHRDENQNLNLSKEEMNKALRNISFNYNNMLGILLANSQNDDKIMPYIFTDNTPSYDSIRDDIKINYGPSSKNTMVQIRIINDIINGVPPENINIEYNEELPDYIVSGEDYYIAYKKGNVDIFVLDSCKENLRTIKEIDSILKNNNLKNSTSKGESR